VAQRAADTGVGPVAIVAVEQHFPENARVINDAVSVRMLPLGMKAYAWLSRFSWARDFMIRAGEKKAPGIWAMALCRKRYIDDKVGEAVAERVETVVNLGAGFDTLALRLPALADIPVWEVDQPDNIATKQSRLIKAFGKIPAHLTLVSLDFDSQDLASVLAAHGYVGDTKTLFILEGVTQYLTEAGIQKIFSFLARAPTQSRLVFTYVRKDFLDGKALYGQEFLYQKMLVKDEIWHSGIDPEHVADFLGGYAWRVLEHVGYDELVAEYVKPTGRQLEPVAIERLVYAEKL
jgi:methyltransferase (TIGR00027 family)